MMFNVVVDNSIRTWLAMTLEYQRVAHGGLGETVGQCVRVFYAKDGMVGSRDSDWLQHTINALVVLFRGYGLVANVAKSFTITCHPGSLWEGVSEEVMALKCTGVGNLYEVRLQRRIICLECGLELAAGP